VGYSRCLVTGANGFVGRELVCYLQASDKHVVSAVRKKLNQTDQNNPIVVMGDINGQTRWKGLLDRQDVVIHLANRAHVMHEDVADPLALCREINVEGTLALARAAVAAGVKRFIYLSSIKVNGEATFDRPFRNTDSPNPEDPYAVSKLEAEQGLQKLCSDEKMELVIIRPPLIYGPGVKGNLAILSRLVGKFFPFPLASVKNARDLISLGNLTDLIKTCVDHPKASGQTFLCCDGGPISTPDLIRYIARAQHKPALLFPFPLSVLSSLARVSGKTGIFDRLSGNLRIDMTHTRELLDWTPPISVADSMEWAFGNVKSS